VAARRGEDTTPKDDSAKTATAAVRRGQEKQTKTTWQVRYMNLDDNTNLDVDAQEHTDDGDEPRRRHKNYNLNTTLIPRSH